MITEQLIKIIEDVPIPDNVLERQVSIFGNAQQTEKPNFITIENLLNDIKSNDVYRNIIEKARKLLETDKSKNEVDGNGKLKTPLYDNFKIYNIPAFTMSAYCNHRKADQKNNGIKKLNYHTGILQIDIDKIPSDVFTDIRNLIKTDEHILFCFRSPSGYGLKAGCFINNNEIKHTNSFKQAENYFNELLLPFNLTIDTAPKNLFSLCFISHDPDIYINPKANILQIKNPSPSNNQNEVSAILPKPENLGNSTKSTFTDNERRTKYANEAIENAKNIINKSVKGNKHNARLIAGMLLGGYIAGGFFSKEYAISEIQSTVFSNTDFKPKEKAMKDIKDGIEAGMKKPITFEMKENERKSYNKQRTQEKNQINNKDKFIKQNNQLVDKETGEIIEPIKKRNLTDLGNAERLLDKHRNIIRFNCSTQKWHIWDNTRWKIDEKHEIMNLAKETVRSIYYEASQTANDTERKEIASFAKKSEARNQIEALVKLAATTTDINENIKCLSEDFDKIPYLFNCKNGIYDLKNMKFLNHDSEYMLSKISNVNFNSEATCDNFIEALNLWFDNDFELIDFVQKCCSLSLVGEHYEEAFYFAYGNGKNGKSVFFKVMESVFGEFYQTAPSEMLLKQQQSGIPHDIASLPSTRFVVCEELPENRTLDEAKIKRITGGDSIKARFLHKEFFEFKATCQLWLMGNHKPMVRGNDEGIWRRAYVIPFTVTIPDEKKKPQVELMQIFNSELDGIFNWLLEGWEMYKKEGFKNIPPRVKAATAQYRKENDKVADFIQECCELDLDYKIEAQKLYTQYIKYARSISEICMSKNKFYDRVGKHEGITSTTGNSNKKYFRGVNLQPDLNPELFNQ